MQEFNGGGDHYGNFLKAVRSRKHEDLQRRHSGRPPVERAVPPGQHLVSPGHADVGRRSEGAAAKRCPAPSTWWRPTQRFTEHLTDNKLDLATTKLASGPTLAIDTANETFVDNSAADALLTREYRAPFVVPPAGQV